MRGYLCDIFIFICEALIVWSVSFLTNLNIFVSPIDINNVVPLEVFKIMIQIPVLGVYLEENWVTHRFKAQDDVLEYIIVLKAA